MTGSSESRFPENVKDYFLLEYYGDGVYRARCNVLYEIVSVKTVDLEKSEDDMETILNEVHPQPHCSFLDGNSFWIVMPYVADNKDKLKTDEVPSEPAQFLPMLQNLLLNTEVQRERLIGLMHLYDPTAADNTNLKANTEAAGQISATEAADLSLEVQYLLERYFGANDG